MKYLKINEANERVTELEAALEKTKTDLAAESQADIKRLTDLVIARNEELQAKVSELKTAADTLAEKDVALAQLTAENESLKAEAKTSSEKAAAIVAAQGVNQNELPAAVSGETPEMIYAEWQKMKPGPERLAFTQKHWDTLNSHQ